MNQPLEISNKWDKWRLIIMWGDIWTSFTTRNAVQAARRSGCWVVVACVPDKIVPILDKDFKVLPFWDYWDIDYDSVLWLMNQSHAICFGIGIEAPLSTISKIVTRLLDEVWKPIVLDADWVKCIQEQVNILNERKSRHQITILTLNTQETEYVFGSKTPSSDIVSAFSVQNWVHILLKWPSTKVYIPDGSIKNMTTNDCPEMANAGSGDVLIGLIWWFLAQGRTPLESILAAVEIRRAAAKYYLSKTGDIVAQPEDIVDNIRYVIWSLHPMKINSLEDKIS